MISDDNTESQPMITVDNPDGCPVQMVDDFQKPSSICCLQITPCSTAIQEIPTQSPPDIVGGNYTCPTTYGVGPQAEQGEFFSTLLSSALRGTVDDICKDEQINEDLLSRVILGERWDTVFNLMGPVSCPLWTVLRYLDEAALQECRPIDRLALLHAVHIMYLVWSAQTSYVAEMKANGLGSLLWLAERAPGRNYHNGIALGTLTYTNVHRISCFYQS